MSIHLRLIFALLVFTLAAITYWNGLDGGFLFDDNANIVSNTAIHISGLSWDTLRASISGLQAGPLGRPVSVLSFALTHYFYGLNPIAYKATNLAIHAVNGLLVAQFLLLLLKSFQSNSRDANARNSWLAIWVAIVWVVHPINVVPVLLAVQRMTLLAGTFCLLALIAYLKATDGFQYRNMRWGWMALSWLVFWPLAMLSKETGILFPLFALAILYMRPVHEIQANKLHARSKVLLSILLLSVGVGMLAYLGWDWLDGAYGTRSFTLVERLMTEARVLFFYASQILFPNPSWFSLYHDDFQLSTSIFQPAATALAIATLGVATGAIVFLRLRFPIPCLAVLWFIVGHSLESSFLPLELVHEYRNYIPSIGLILGASWIGLEMFNKVKLDHATATKMMVGGGIVALCSVITWTRTSELGNSLIGSQIAAALHPNSARANHAAAVALIQAQYGDKGDPLGAQSVRFYLTQATKVDPTFKVAPLTLIIWACASGRPVEAQWLEALSWRLANTPFGPQENDLPMLILRPLIDMPQCLQRQEALAILSAALSNPKVASYVKAQFLEAAADYELLVSLAPKSSLLLLKRAIQLAPADVAVQRKAKGLLQITQEAGLGEQ